jgi:hypothetical protein
LSWSRLMVGGAADVVLMRTPSLEIENSSFN